MKNNIVVLALPVDSEPDVREEFDKLKGTTLEFAAIQDEHIWYTVPDFIERISKDEYIASFFEEYKLTWVYSTEQTKTELEQQKEFNPYTYSLTPETIVVRYETLCKALEAFSTAYGENRTDVSEIIDNLLETGELDLSLVEHRFATMKVPVDIPAGYEIEYDTLTTLFRIIDPVTSQMLVDVGELEVDYHDGKADEEVPMVTLLLGNFTFEEANSKHQGPHVLIHSIDQALNVPANKADEIGEEYLEDGTLAYLIPSTYKGEIIWDSVGETPETIDVKWTMYDVKKTANQVGINYPNTHSKIKSLTDTDYREIMKNISHNHDAEIGINWASIENAIISYINSDTERKL